jgi:predicted RNA methylase
MAKLSKVDIKAHEQACKLLTKDVLSYDEREFVLENWQEGARHINSAAGAFFTPAGLSNDLAIEVGRSQTVVDLCAGIGRLAFSVYHAHYDFTPSITCVEINPDYVAVGKKVLPEATWILGDIFDVYQSLPMFDCAISNPPFGRVKANARGPVYKGADFEFKVIDVASAIAHDGVFILPQVSSPFRLSGQRCYEPRTTGKAVDFQRLTGITLEPNCGFDTSVYRDDWRGVSPAVEIVLADFRKEVAA